jgi:predicted MPP superfamily phosphohydrolase
MLQEAGLSVLVNECVLLRADEKTGFGLVGLDDLWEGQPGTNDVFAEVPGDWPVVVLAHNADHAEQLDPARVGFIISGHTHGGQVCWFPGKAFYTANKTGFLSGVFRVNDIPVYISRGTGAINIPCRMMSPPEISFIRFYADRD